MIPSLIVMLTYNDQTIPDALQVFENCKDLPVKFWGFKDVGLPVDQMKTLVAAIKKAGKVSFLEVVRYTERECQESASLALDCGFDYLMGTVFYKSVFELLKKRTIQYFPFCGKVSRSPSVLEGTIEDIIGEAQTLASMGVPGFDLLAYRFTGDAENLAERFVREVQRPVVIAGSINSFARLDRMKEINPWGFTIGGAFFDKKFVKNGSVREQIDSVHRYLGGSTQKSRTKVGGETKNH